MTHLSSYIDHTLLKPTATKAEIIQLCEEAKKFRFFSVCTNSYFTSLAKEHTQNSNVKVCTVVGFPLGAMSTEAKIYETIQALKDGADEIDMVINLGLLKAKDYTGVIRDIASVKNRLPNQVLKVIIETCYLTEDEIITASELTIKAGADFIKTSTGFGPHGATIEHVRLMKSIAKDHAKIKASGGIKDFKTAIEYIKLGVDRIGTSAGITIVTGK
ncbi:deoxyribose-phosphate aldolase [Aestuariibaculum suncheonense]|uniref:Deoxyribose-phosphate aldolase n=1 Tax=Aestuariibaculum suncheonense TaxID=1028745 RepID=A0A8J6Q8N3_9FLAO|nr:deoxyribose-phosphate aldolase [Aestuariibaculum suncheonense]MBD0835796.1 deoxyribose-phosphate aldolase [Aestuariibaculum suncheonense]